MASATHPVAEAKGERSVAIGGPARDVMVVTGDWNTFKLYLSGRSALLMFAFRWDRPRRRRRRARDAELPPPFELHVDRDDEVAELLPAGGVPRVVNLFGPAGIGKTYVLLAALNRPESSMRDGIVYLDGRDQNADDLLHRVFGKLYECRIQRRDLQIGQLLGRRRAVLALEDVKLTSDDAQRLTLGALRSRLIVTSRAQVLFDGTPVSLGGLPPEVAGAIAEQELRRPLDAHERAAAESIAAALGGHPFALRRAFGRARDEGRGRPLHELKDLLLETSADGLIAGLTPPERGSARAGGVQRRAGRRPAPPRHRRRRRRGSRQGAREPQQRGVAFSAPQPCRTSGAGAGA